MTILQARWQMRNKVYVGIIVNSAKAHGFPPEYVLAIASRETGIRNLIGDGGHGIGVMQIDVRYHEIASDMKHDGTWKTNAGALIDYGVRAVLKPDYEWAQKTWPKLQEFQHLKIAASAYNAGRGGAAAGVKQGDSDIRTTGHDYGADVVYQRMPVFAKALALAHT